MIRSAKLQALAASARLANVPSVVSNVWLGCVLAYAGSPGVPSGPFSGRAGLLVMAGVSLYLAGNFLNDWADRAWDAVHRPERALPQKMFPAGVYLVVATGCGALALGAAARVNEWALSVVPLIGLCILLYTWAHKRTAWAIIPMALCRALLPALGWLGCIRPAGGPPPGWATVIVLIPILAGQFCYIAGLSLSARNESQPMSTGGITRSVLVLFPLAAAWMFAESHLICVLPLGFCLLGLAPYCLWNTLSLTVYRQPVSCQVASLLAGIPLVDWIVLLPVALELWVMGYPQPLPVLCLAMPPCAVLAGKLLQRLAPAT